MKVECGFSVLSQLNVKYDTETGEKTVADVKSTLAGVTSNMDLKSYFDPKTGLPNKDGVKAITNTLIHAISGNIHYAHKQSIRNDADHLRFVVDELQKAFVQQVQVVTGEMEMVGVKDANQHNMAWTEPVDGQIDVPEQYEELFNKIVTQLRFHKISGKDEVLTAVHLISIANDFFNEERRHHGI